MTAAQLAALVGLIVLALAWVTGSPEVGLAGGALFILGGGRAVADWLSR